MKKLIALLLSAAMATLMLACGDGGNGSNHPDGTPVDSAKGLLSAVWADLPEDERFFVTGGDYDAPVENDAGTVTSTDFLTFNLLLPEALHSQVDEAASLIHGMNANSMTLGAYHLTADASADDFAATMREVIQGNHWMCGFPEELFIAAVDDYVLVGFGLADNMNAIETHLTGLYTQTQILYQEAIAA